MKLGRVGVWLGSMANLPAAELRAAVAAIEAMGFGTIWIGEATAREPFASSASAPSRSKLLVSRALERLSMSRVAAGTGAAVEATGANSGLRCAVEAGTGSGAGLANSSSEMFA